MSSVQNTLLVGNWTFVQLKCVAVIESPLRIEMLKITMETSKYITQHNSTCCPDVKKWLYIQGMSGYFDLNVSKRQPTHPVLFPHLHTWWWWHITQHRTQEHVIHPESQWQQTKRRQVVRWSPRHDITGSRWFSSAAALLHLWPAITPRCVYMFVRVSHLIHRASVLLPAEHIVVNKRYI